MNRSDAAPARPQDNNAAAPNTKADPTDSADALFARKGAAAPAPIKGGRPAIYLVGDETPSDEGDGDREPKSASPDKSFEPREAALFDLDDASENKDTATAEKDMGAKIAQSPAASLDSDPFDPSLHKLVKLDDAPVERGNGTTEKDSEPELDDEAPPAAVVGRARLLTATLVGAAAAAAIAAMVTAFNWYDFSNRPPVPAAQTAEANAPEAVPAEPAAILTAEITDTAPPAALDKTPAPVIDLIRVEPDGSTVIAGRAAPGTALIVLDNDAAIGSVTAGETGDWMLVPETPLAGGEHEIALAVKAGDGAISVGVTPEAASARASPTPRPLAGPSYVVQVASVKTAQGAQREWAKLKAALPDLLGKLEPTIDTAELRDRGTFYRIRLGPFGNRDQARALCSAMTGAGKDCLVLRR